MIYHVKASATDSIQDIGDSQGRIIAGISGNSVRDGLHRDTTVNRVTVGGVETYI